MHIRQHVPGGCQDLPARRRADGGAGAKRYPHAVYAVAAVAHETQEQGWASGA